LNKVSVHKVASFGRDRAAGYVSYVINYSSEKQLMSVEEGHTEHACYC